MICLDNNYSTTRLLFEYKQHLEEKPSSEIENTLLLPATEQRKGEGGLRTRGYIKQNFPQKPLITVITVVFNSEKYLEETIESVINQSYDNVDYIVIDGASTDGTPDVIKKYDSQLDYWVSEQDRGIYDAMNKGLDVAFGEWLVFMNAGDIFHDNQVIENSIEQLSAEIDILYSDVLFRGKRNRIFHCTHKKMRFIHQGVIYRRSLHEAYGKYLVATGVIISDYLFFNSVSHLQWKKSKSILAICDDGGVSARPAMFYQKMAVDLLFERRGRIFTSCILIFYPFYRFFKKIVISITGIINAE